MLKDLLAGGPGSLVRKTLLGSPLLVAATWFLYKTEKGQALRSSLMKRVEGMVGKIDTAPAKA